MSDRPSGDRGGATGARLHSAEPGGGGDEQALVDGEQTLGDPDRTLSDADQRDAEGDQTPVDRHQLAPDSDQVASDRALASGGDLDTRAVSRDLRRRNAARHHLGPPG